jgi:hypothetical protein
VRQKGRQNVKREREGEEKDRTNGEQGRDINRSARGKGRKREKQIRETAYRKHAEKQNRQGRNG